MILQQGFIEENLMGPNSLRILKEVLEGCGSLEKGMRVLDLGCGKGLTSLYLASNFETEVYAVDLWISATENYERFQEMGAGLKLIPIHADAQELPFANGYFDAIVTIDSYHYFGNNDWYFSEKLLPLLKPNALVVIAFPGMKEEVGSNVPEEMRPYWEEDALETWHSIEWWRSKFEPYLEQFSIRELDCFDEAWQDWLQTDNPYAVGDRDMMKADGGRYMNLIGVVGRVKTDLPNVL